MATLVGDPKFCSGTKFLKSSRLLQVVSELTNILNFPEGFKIFKIHHSRQKVDHEMEMAGCFFENGRLLT